MLCITFGGISDARKRGEVARFQQETTRPLNYTKHSGCGCGTKLEP
jgi:hypothetical protein